MKSKDIEVLRSTRGDLVQVALYSRVKNAVVTIGKFPKGCPEYAIYDWVRQKENEFSLVL